MSAITKGVDPLLFLTARLGRLVASHIQNRLEEEDRDMIGPNMGILADLMEKDGVRQQDLAMSSIKDKATITRGIQALEQKELVLRVDDPVDKRTKRIYITQKGKRFFQRISPVGKEVIDEALQGVAAQDLHICLRVLRQMYDNLSK
ncbi:MAG: MarR family transcriptional regulator [Saprospiraceae bacterium]